MQKPPLKHLIYWGMGGAAVGAIPLLWLYASDQGLGDPLPLAALITPFVVLWGVAAGVLTHYTWTTGARPVACLLGVASCFLSLIELLVGGFFGPTGLSGWLLPLLGFQYSSTWGLIFGVAFAGLLYEAALLAVLLVIRQLFRWTNWLIAIVNPKG